MIKYKHTIPGDKVEDISNPNVVTVLTERTEIEDARPEQVRDQLEALSRQGYDITVNVALKEPKESATSKD